MSNNIFTSLPSLTTSLDDSDERKATLLSPIHAAFFIPKLENKPQNPIIDSLDLTSIRITPRQVQTNGMINGNGNDIKPATVNGPPKPDTTIPMNTVEEKKGGENIWLIAASGSDAHGVSKRSHGPNSPFSQNHSRIN
jgi:hypothetical protein